MTLTDSTAFSFSRRQAVGATLSAEETITGAALTVAPTWNAESDAAHDWVHDVAMAIKELLILSEGWDGGVAAPISSAAASLAKHIAEQAASPIPGLRRPAVNPTVDGRVVLTWHGPDAHVELTCSDIGAEVFYEIESSGQEWEGDLREVPSNPADLLVEHFS